MADIYNCDFCKNASDCNFLYDKENSIPCAVFEPIDLENDI